MDMDISMSELRGCPIDTVPEKFIVLDIETTGFSYRDSIIEFAALRIYQNEIIDELTFLAKPSRPIPPHITELTGITNHMVSGMENFYERAKDVLDFIGDDIIVGHNIIFDIDRINHKLCEIDAPTLSNDYIDTKCMAKSRITNIENFSLGSIAHSLNIDIDNAHRALDDCYTTLKCLDVLVKLPEIDYNSEYIHCSRPVKAYRYLNQVDFEITTPVNLRGKRYYIHKNPYYISTGRLERVLYSMGAKTDCVYSRAITHIILNYKDYDKYRKTGEIYELYEYKYDEEELDEYGIDKQELDSHGDAEVICELDLYKMLGIYIPDKFLLQKAEKKNYGISAKSIMPTVDNIDENNPIFGKVFVITGALNTMSRAESYQLIKNKGGLCGDCVTKKTNYLVTNSSDMTSKLKKALQYKNAGQDIKIINENELLKLLN